MTDRLSGKVRCVGRTKGCRMRSFIISTYIFSKRQSAVSTQHRFQEEVNSTVDTNDMDAVRSTPHSDPAPNVYTPSTQINQRRVASNEPTPQPQLSSGGGRITCWAKFYQDSSLSRYADVALKL